ncbi:CLUMA_CG006011, isoform A [Clunio marinus]|uniref:CLUMA_CG006011, isoform A n=1 Tax=Clunio marinus TaxID=568069 RepID=A0A1J1HYN9_9DIPT|nr:CLUMA_CG006011, isoform A [Clunio marinus]
MPALLALKIYLEMFMEVRLYSRAFFYSTWNLKDIALMMFFFLQTQETNDDMFLKKQFQFSLHVIALDSHLMSANELWRSKS